MMFKTKFDIWKLEDSSEVHNCEYLKYVILDT